MKIILLGPPGSGKGSQADLLAKEYNLKKISVGKILRRISKRKTKLGRLLDKLMDKGRLVPDITANKIIKKEITNNFVIDGYPRDLREAKFLNKITKIDYIFLLDTSEKTMIKRLSNRRQCINGHIYNLITKKPRRQGICNICKKSLFQREDDTLEVIKKRIEIYKKQTLPVLKYYKNRIIKVDGNKEFKEVNKLIIKYIKKQS